MSEEETKEEAPKSKPGVRTSEFWGTMGAHMVGLILVALGQYKASDGLTQVGAILMGLAQGSYNIGRSMEKGSVAKALGAMLSKGAE